MMHAPSLEGVTKNACRHGLAGFRPGRKTWCAHAMGGVAVSECMSGTATLPRPGWC